MADKEGVDSTPNPDPTADTDGPQAGGSHALRPAVGGVPAGAEDQIRGDEWDDSLDGGGAARHDRDAAELDDREAALAEARDDHADPSEDDRLDDDPLPDDSLDHGLDDKDSDRDKELVTVGAATQEQAGGAVETAAAARARSKKDKATPRQKQVAVKEARTGPVKFLRESVGELQKVVYPTGQQLVNYFIVVLIFVLFIIAIVSLLDLAFGKAILAVFS